ncbi:MAG: UDP-N-acetylmuramoyl-tripeptide--D-alanyl-D-alanine ligase [Candidatus Omnitrophota bacterium]
MEFTLKEISEIVSAKLIQGTMCAQEQISGVSINTRTLREGDLFMAIRGQQFDGHHFVREAVRKGAKAVIVSQARRYPGVNHVPVFYVKDTVKALGEIARAHRRKFKVAVIAITGSTGKTTSKEMIAAVLGSRFRVLKNIGTENNHIGVPLTLLKLTKKVQVAVVEFGTNRFGDIAWLAKVAEPDAAVFTNIGESHLQYLRSPAGVFKEKSQLIRYLSPEGAVIFNHDNGYLRKIKTFKGKQTISYGITGGHLRASAIVTKRNNSLQFQVNNRNTINIRTVVPHNVYNALAAVACARLFGISFRDIRKALGRFKFPAGRSMVLRKKGRWLINDTYNANPLSFRSALDTLSNLKICGKKILVCGDMLELGKQSKKLHRDIGAAAASQADMIFSVGEMARWITSAAKEANPAITVQHFDSLGSLNQKLLKCCRPGDSILVKASRAMRLERTVDFLTENL